MSLKEIKQRIASVKNTQKITSAMKLVSAVKLRRAQNAIDAMNPYRQKLDEILNSLLSDVRDFTTPYAAVRDVKRVAVVAISSNSGLCGSFNATIIRKTKELIGEYRSAGVDSMEIYPVGKKIASVLANEGFSCNDALLAQAASVQYSIVADVARKLMNDFITGKLDRIEIVYTRFISPAKHEAVCETFLPISINNSVSVQSGTQYDYIVEPSREYVLENLLPQVVALNLYTALLHSAASEHGARMIAMQIATDNADELITDLTREYNKGRQQAITNELLDMISGSMNQ